MKKISKQKRKPMKKIALEKVGDLSGPPKHLFRFDAYAAVTK